MTQCHNSVTACTASDSYEMIVAGYVSHPRWLDVLLFPDRLGSSTRQSNRPSDKIIAIYFPSIIITSSRLELDGSNIEDYPFVWISFKLRSVMSAVNTPINHFSHFIEETAIITLFFV